MRTIFALCAILLVLGGVLLWRFLAQPTQFGEFTGSLPVQVIDVIEHPQKYLKQTVAIEGTITKQCTSMGCYFFFVENNQELRIDLAEVAMHAPRGRNGRRARVEGRTVPYDGGYQFMASAVEFK